MLGMYNMNKQQKNLNIDTLDYRDHKELYLKLREEKRETLDIDFGLYPDIIKSRYLDIYEGAYAEMVYANKFNKNSDLSMTYLGQTKLRKDFLTLVKGLLQENY